MRKITYILLLFLLCLSFPHIIFASTMTPITHVIIVIDENHSFDNIFGAYPFGNPPIVNNITRAVMRPLGIPQGFSIPVSVYFPFLGSVSPSPSTSAVVQDPSEGPGPYSGDLWFGTAEGFYTFSGPSSLDYFSYQQLGPLWDYAEEYTIADHFFAPVLGFTEPNRVADIIGYPPSFSSDHVDCAIPFNNTVMYQLSSHNVSWGYFVYDLPQGSVPFPLTAFIGSSQFSSHYQNLSLFLYDLNHGDLPSVSWVMFLGGSSDRYDMHPPANVTEGAIQFANLVNAVERSPYWGNTVIFFTMDEGGDFFDQVIPPKGFGQRIPLLVISPYSKEGYVIHGNMSPYTLLAFIDYNWGLPYLTSYVRDSNLGSLLSGFNFSERREPIVLTPSNWTYPIPLQYPINYSSVDQPVTYVVQDHVPSWVYLQSLGMVLAPTLIVLLLLFRLRSHIPFLAGTRGSKGRG